MTLTNEFIVKDKTMERIYNDAFVYPEIRNIRKILEFALFRQQNADTNRTLSYLTVVSTRLIGETVNNRKSNAA